MRSPVEDLDLVPSLPDNAKSQTHSRVLARKGAQSVSPVTIPALTTIIVDNMTMTIDNIDNTIVDRLLS